MESEARVRSLDRVAHHGIPVFRDRRGGEPRLRVALFVDSLQIGGTELNAVRTAEGLLTREIDVVLVVFQSEGPLLARCRASGVPVIPFPIPPMGSVRSVTRGIELFRQLRRLDVDVVHTQDRYTNAFVVPWARLAGARVLASRRWWDVHPSRALGLGGRVAYRLAHGVVANSERVADLVCRADGVPRRKVSVVPNFLDDTSLQAVSEPERRKLRARLGVPPDALVIGAVANLRPVKDHRTLLDAMALLTPRWPELVLCLVGDGALRPELEAQAARLGITHRVIFAGTRSDPVNWHWAFDVSVLTSLNEGFPNTVVEAMAAAKPVVATAVGGTPDAVRDGETGFLVPPGSAAALAASLARLLEDPELCKTLGQAGRAVALDRFTAGAVMPGVEALYRSVAGRPREGGVAPMRERTDSLIPRSP
jgi:L-malate glycosyltransferase